MNQSSRGSTPIQLLLVLTTLALVGYTIDYIRLEYYQIRLNNSLDLSIQSADQMLVQGSYGGIYELMRANVDSEFIGLSSAADWQAKFSITDVTASVPDPKPEGIKYLKLKVDVPIKTYFMGYFGINTLNLSSSTYLQYVDLPPVTDIATTSGNTCAISIHKDVWCWGAGYPSTTADPSILPYKLPIGKAVQSLAINYSSGCAITDAPYMASETYCWNNAIKALGTHSLIKVPELDGAIKLSLNPGISCALKADGSVVCWGEFSQNGQNGDGTATTSKQRTWPPKNVLISDVKDIATTWMSACALTNSNQVYCWGDNLRGELADGFFDSGSYTGNYFTDISFYKYSYADGPNDVSPFRSLIPVGPAAGITNPDRFFVNSGQAEHFRSLGVITTDGKAYAWGNNNQAAFDLPMSYFNTWQDKPETSTPQQFLTTNIHDGIMTFGCVCVRTNDDLSQLKCRGTNVEGCLSTTDYLPGYKVYNFTPIKGYWTGIPYKLSSGNTMNYCVIDQDLVPWCWGRNHSGALGYGTFSPGYYGAPLSQLPKPIVRQKILYAL